MNRYLELDVDGFVINVIVWDGIAPYNSGYTVVPCVDNPAVTYGWQMVNGGWVAPLPSSSEDEMVNG